MFKRNRKRRYIYNRMNVFTSSRRNRPDYVLVHKGGREGEREGSTKVKQTQQNNSENKTRQNNGIHLHFMLPNT